MPRQLGLSATWTPGWQATIAKQPIAESRIASLLGPPRRARFPKARNAAFRARFGVSWLHWRNSKIITESSEKVNIYPNFLLCGEPRVHKGAAQQSFAVARKLFSQSAPQAGNRPVEITKGEASAILLCQCGVAGAQAQFRLAGAVAQP